MTQTSPSFPNGPQCDRSELEARASRVAKHTPGPWAVSENFSEHGFTDNDGGIPIIGNAADPDGRERIGTALTTKHFPRGKTYKAIDHERDANARLIAAAPDLLAALQRSEQYLILAVHDNKGDLRAIAMRDLKMVQDAICRATGETPLSMADVIKAGADAKR